MDQSPSSRNNAVPIVRGADQPSEYSQHRSPTGYGYAISSHQPLSSHSDDNANSGILAYWRILRLHKGTWLLCAFLGTILGFLITLPQTSVYQAKTAIEIQNLNDNFMNMRQSTQVYEGAGGVTDSSEIPTQIRILQSDTIMDRVVAQLKADGVTPSESSRLTAWRRLLNIPEPDKPHAAARILDQVASSVKARATGQTRVIEITADSPDPKLAATFLNTLTSKFIELNLESRWKSTEKTAEWLSRQLDDMRIKLEKSEDSLQQYARDSGLLFTDEKTNVSSEKLKQLQQELSSASSARIARQSTYELAQQSSPDALPDVLNDATLRETAAKVRDLRAQIADLSAVYTPDYAKVKRAQAELSALQSTFDRDRAAILGRIQNEFKDAARREQLLQAAYEAQTRQVTLEGEKSIQYNILKREVDSNRQLYDSMLAQLKQSSIASAMRASNLRVVDLAKVPAAPYKPDLKQSLGVGTLAGVFLGAAFIVARFRANRTIQQPGECALFLNIPELGIIPSGKKAHVFGANQTAEKRADHSIELVTLQSRPSPVAEGFRSALISILFTGDQSPKAKPRTLVLTSPNPGEGKSTIASNLAISIAEIGRKVLLIDADMRRPRQHEVFSVDNKTGLSSLLKNRTPLNGDFTLGGAIRETSVPNLWILPSGPGTTSATNLLYSSHMADLVQHLERNFDAILIDTPPMLQIPDARVVARLADSVIMVVRSAQTTRDAIAAGCQRFSEDGTKVLGTILNDWNPKSSPNGYYGYDDKSLNRYGSYYQQSESDKSNEEKINQHKD